MKLKFRMVSSSTATSFEPRPRGRKHVTQASVCWPKALRSLDKEFLVWTLFSNVFE